MSLISSLRLSSLPSISRRLVHQPSLPSLISSPRCISTQSTAFQSKTSSSSLLVSSFFSAFRIPSRSFGANSLVAPGANRLVLSKGEAISYLETEAAELNLPDDPEITTFISSNKLTVETSETDVRLIRTDEKARLEVRFALMPDNDTDPETLQQPPVDDKKIALAEGVGDGAHTKPMKHSFMVQVRTPAEQNNFLHLNCHADDEGRIVIEHLVTDEAASKKLFEIDEKGRDQMLDMFDTSAAKFLNFEDLPDAPAEKVYNVLCDLGIDDRLALFVQQYAYIVRTKQQKEKVKSLAKFIDSIP